jgi:hypothetical protein
VDRVRQVATRFGLRPYRVFLVWTQFGGAERGEGTEREVARIEILPAPKVISLDSVALAPQTAGILPMGSIRVEKISVSLTLDQLKGRMIPVPHEDHIPVTYSFHYEVREDGRGDTAVEIMKFRLASDPFRRAGKIDWVVNLERIGVEA